VARFLVDGISPIPGEGSACRGFDAQGVRDVGLRGRPDRDIFDSAASEGRALLTGDLGFGNVLAFPPATHHGVLVARFPNDTLVRTLNDAILAAIATLTDDDIEHSVVVIEPGRIRLRRGR
jgi:predicted nuclease of predicted toxin-antitoxin system